MINNIKNTLERFFPLDVIIIAFILFFAVGVLFCKDLYVHAGDAYQVASYSVQFLGFPLRLQFVEYVSAITRDTWVIAPFQLLWGGCFVLLFSSWGVIKSLLLSQFVMLGLLLLSMLVVLRNLFHSRKIAYIGLLLFSVTPFIRSLTYAYMQELSQIFAIVLFIYFLLNILKKDIISLSDVFGLILSIIICLAVKVSTISHVFVPMLAASFIAFRQRKTLQQGPLIHLLFFIFSLCLLGYITALFYYNNFNSFSDYFSYACLERLWPWTVRLPFFAKLRWGAESLVFGYFPWIGLFIFFVILFLVNLFHKKKRQDSLVSFFVLVSWINILWMFFFFTFLGSFEVSRYFSTLLPWITIILCDILYCLKRRWLNLIIILLGVFLVASIIFHQYVLTNKSITFYAQDRIPQSMFLYKALSS